MNIHICDKIFLIILKYRRILFIEYCLGSSMTFSCQDDGSLMCVRVCGILTAILTQRSRWWKLLGLSYLETTGLCVCPQEWYFKPVKFSFYRRIASWVHTVDHWHCLNDSSLPFPVHAPLSLPTFCFSNLYFYIMPTLTVKSPTFWSSKCTCRWSGIVVSSKYREYGFILFHIH